MSSGKDLSIIVTAHNEGIIAHKTMLSIFRAAKKLEENKVSYEILVHVDNGTIETKDYFSKYKSHKTVRVFYNNFGDLSSSRNFLVEKAKGELISVMDADDLCSENWLIDSYNIVKKDSNKVAHFNYMITFGDSEDIPVVTRNSECSKNEMLIELMDSNRYGSAMTCAKRLLSKIPQRKNTPPFGAEDQQWILDSMNLGVEHTIVPETVHFYRKDTITKTSLLNSQRTYGALMSLTETLSYDNVSKLDAPAVQSTTQLPRSFASRVKNVMKRRAKERLYHTLVYANTFKTYRAIRGRTRGARRYGVMVPGWLLQEWRSINKIEKLLFPTKRRLERSVYWEPDRSLGAGYINLAKALSKKPDTLFFVPWLHRGGADKVFINTINQIKKQHKSWNIAVLQTHLRPSVWQNKLSDRIDFVDIASIMNNMSEDNKMRLLAIFITQNGVKRIIIGNSKLAYDFAKRYKNLLRHLNVVVYTFAFCETIDSDGRIADYIHEDLPLIQDVVYKIVTDNSSIVDQLHDEHGINKDKIRVHHQYLDNKFKSPEIKANKKPIKVLWAGRISKQKTPEVLLRIGKRISKDFEIDVFGEIEQDYSKNFFLGAPNINYKRRFNGIDDLPAEDYDIFLYTSSSDGMPNMLLEIASKGLPIIAPDVGGISDLIIDKKTGILIDDYRNHDAYIDGLNALKDADLRLKLAQNAQKKLKAEFNKKSWQDKTKEIFDR